VLFVRTDFEIAELIGHTCRATSTYGAYADRTCTVYFDNVVVGSTTTGPYGATSLVIKQSTDTSKASNPLSGQYILIASFSVVNTSSGYTNNISISLNSHVMTSASTGIDRPVDTGTYALES